MHIMRTFKTPLERDRGGGLVEMVPRGITEPHNHSKIKKLFSYIQLANLLQITSFNPHPIKIKVTLDNMIPKFQKEAKKRF